MKLPDWATRLDAYIDSAASMPFSYNNAIGMDCCSFTFGAIHAQTGIAIGQRFAGRYRTRREALLMMCAYCGRPSLAMFISQLMKDNGFHRTSPTLAQRGDVLLTANGVTGDYLGVLDLNGKDILSVGEHGVRRVPISINCLTWRIA
jgi:cell wall-associated NlpC family hydrolase